MDVILKFDRVNYEKHRTCRNTIIESGTLLEVKERCKILKIDVTKYGYRKAVVELVHSGLRIMMEIWETKINEYLKGEGIPPIKILYDNKIYLKTVIRNPTDASTIKIKSVWVNNENKPFP